MQQMELNPEDRFEKVLIEMVDLHRRKAADYAPKGHANATFHTAGEQVDLSAGQVVELLIAVKQARLQQLLPAFWSMFTAGKDQWSAVNEPVNDTLLDRAVYAVIALTIWNEGGYTK